MSKKQLVLNTALLRKLLRKWIKILRLSSPKWEEITVQFGAEKQDEDEPIGFCTWSFEERRAQVFIVSSKSYEETYGEPLSIEKAEKILIHELLHIVMQYGSDYSQTFEQGLNVLADVLWEAYGENGG